MYDLEKMKILFSTNKRKNATCDTLTCISAFLIILCILARQIDVEELKDNSLLMEVPETEEDNYEQN